MQIKVPFLDLWSHHQPLMSEFNRAIQEVIESSAFAGGKFVEDFEHDFSAYCNAPYTIGVGSGTEALWLSLLACGVGPGDEVITVPSTFMATAEAITYCGARPVFVDVDENTYTMNPEGLREVLTSNTKAIIPVHLFGQPADMDPILDFARKHGLYVIEDACQAHGAEYKGRRVGTLGDTACFSFYPGKNLGAFGEAGAVVTGNTELQEKIRVLRDHGQVRKYFHSMVGWNCRMDGIQGAVLKIKLRQLEGNNERRREHAAHYAAELQEVAGLILPTEADYARHVYHVYAIRVSNRDELMKSLMDEGIMTGIHYPVPVHLQEAYASLGYQPGAFPIAERCAAEFVSLPMYPELTCFQTEQVIAGVKEAVAGGVEV
ncbi:MAG: DegT/DnrJ/EryC1/StrS family aminotransferase [Deltaproteobacteria bacterium]|nr:DegT/DnrJ/EryC1/StrS family aminotransferase [Deltaproteobacteria bacterium]